MSRTAKKPSLRRTSKAQFALFASEAERLCKAWGLNDIRLYFHHAKRDARASFYGRHVKRVGTVTLSTEWEITDGEDRAVTDAEVCECARHEMVHALLLPLACMVGDFCTKDEAEEAEERIVQRLLRILP